MEQIDVVTLAAPERAAFSVQRVQCPSGEILGVQSSGNEIEVYVRNYAPSQPWHETPFYIYAPGHMSGRICGTYIGTVTARYGSEVYCVFAEV